MAEFVEKEEASAGNSTLVVDYDNDPESSEDQLELFLFKFPEVDRDDIEKLLEEYSKHDKGNKGYLEEDEALHLLEHRGETKTFKEMRGMFSDIDIDGDHKLSFLEWCTSHYEKSWELLHTFADGKAFEKAMEKIKEAREAAEKVKQEIEEEKKKLAEAEEKRKKELEEEAKLTGVKGRAAFFKRQMEATQDTTMTNEQRIKMEAAKRKELREAKKLAEKAEKEAELAKDSHKAKEEAERAILEQKKKAEKEYLAKRQAEKDEIAKKRAAFKAKQEAMFGGKKT